jgi:hypothetical protein
VLSERDSPALLLLSILSSPFHRLVHLRSAALAVGLGAFGAHGLKNLVDEKGLQVSERQSIITRRSLRFADSNLILETLLVP